MLCRTSCDSIFECSLTRTHIMSEDSWSSFVRSKCHSAYCRMHIFAYTHHHGVYVSYVWTNKCVSDLSRMRIHPDDQRLFPYAVARKRASHYEIFMSTLIGDANWAIFIEYTRCVQCSLSMLWSVHKLNRFHHHYQYHT